MYILFVANALVYLPLRLKLSTGLATRLLNVLVKVAFQTGIAPQVSAGKSESSRR